MKSKFKCLKKTCRYEWEVDGIPGLVKCIKCGHERVWWVNAEEKLTETMGVKYGPFSKPTED